MKAKAVIFDRDGIIINSDGLVIDCAKKAFKQFGYTVSDEEAQLFIGRSSTVILDHFLNKWDFDPEEFNRISREIFYKNLNSAPFFVETIKLIKSLHTKNIPMAVTTSAGKEGTLLILRNAGIDYMFKVIVTREDCDKLKPDPEPYILTSQKLGIDPAFCVVIEDTSLGVESSKKAGMQCIAIPNEYTENQNFSAADAVLKSAKEVEDLLIIV